MCLSKILFPVFMFLFIFSLPLTFTLLAAPYWPLAFLIRDFKIQRQERRLKSEFALFQSL